MAFLARKFYEKKEFEKSKQISSEVVSGLDLEQKGRVFDSTINYSIYSNIFRTLALVDPDLAFSLVEVILPGSGDYLLRSINRRGKTDFRLSRLLKRHSLSIYSYSGSIKHLAEKDFPRLKALTNYFDQPEFSIFAKILILKTILHGHLDFNNFKDRREMIVIKG